MKYIVRKFINTVIRPYVNKIGVDIIRYKRWPDDFKEEHIRIWEAVKPFTMTSPERAYVLIEAVRHVVENNVKGAMIECGVWK